MTHKANLSNDLSLLVNAVRKGGRIAMKNHGKAGVKSWLKGGVEPVTQIDIEVNRAIKDQLMGARAGYGWLSEESHDNLERLSKKYVWVVDPIDGTRAFMRGNPDFSVTAALLEDNIPVLGVTYAPAWDKFYQAKKGGGAYLNGQKIRVSSPRGLSGIRLQADGGYIGNKKRWALNWPKMEIFKHQSFALRLAAFAEGKTDAVLAARPKSEWDIAAGMVLITEAGGILCNERGRPFTFNRKNTRVHQVVAITPGIKEEFLKILAKRIPKNKP